MRKLDCIDNTLKENKRENPGPVTSSAPPPPFTPRPETHRTMLSSNNLGLLQHSTLFRPTEKNVCIELDTHTRTPVYTDIHTHTHTRASVHAHTRIYTLTLIHICIYVLHE
ncbi:hypothetical protein LOAG_03710 [Loa loa]|uniref:Uncharacterized protein n=1 Tax=Loa loa TaxID=7209 RepID=A0A1S0U3P4_LOALO|nr:hypothetical protein LOAG_03710 [Loa loa]EFO24782.1 hypothetical protein LOAG_03710 [Loa loa]